MKNDNKLNINKNSHICYLSIGSNLGHRKNNIEKAIKFLTEEPFIKILNVSSILEYPALLKDISDLEALNLNYYNVALKIEFQSDDPFLLLRKIQKIEKKFGKKITNEKNFNARKIDIDILLFEGKRINERDLTIPHYDLKNRSFFIDLLCQIDSGLIIDEQDVLSLRRSLKGKNTLLMQIFNINNNSFTKDGLLENGKINLKKLKKNINFAIKNSVPIIDLGVISTAPQNKEIAFTIEKEIEILTQTLMVIYKEFEKSKYKYTLPKISIDTFRYEVMEFLIKNNYHFDIINDQEGFRDKRKIGLFKNTDHQIILMHSFDLPVIKENIMIGDLKFVADEIKGFFNQKKEEFIKNNIDLNRLIIDPGIGFNKSQEQSVFILQNIESFFDLNLKILIGHSRKRFLSCFSKSKMSTNLQKDIKTSLLSAILTEKGCEFLRIHNYKLNQESILEELILQN